MSKISKRDVYVAIPAYNEGKKIYEVVKGVKQHISNVVVVDDGSIDDTSEVAQRAGAFCLKHSVNLGQGAALETAFDYCRKRGAKAVVTFDGDGQFLAEEIKIILLPILSNKADIVFGSRFLGKTINMPVAKRIVLEVGKMFTTIFSEVKLTDTHNGFRALNERALNKIHISQNRMAHASEIIDLSVRNKLRIKEVPVTVTYGKYSIQKGQGVGGAFRIVLDLITRNLYS